MQMPTLRWISDNQLPALLTCLLLLAVVALAAHRYAYRPSFRRRELLTENEREFHRRLLAALPDFEIWPQVPIFALIEPESRQGSARWKRGLRLISNRRVDWVVAGLIAVGALIGGVIGSTVGRRLSPLALRIIIAVIGVVAIVKVVWFP